METYLIEVILNTSIDNELPGEFRLHGAYPNPFNPETIIRYEIPEAGSVRFEVYNMVGQQILQSFTPLLHSGTQSIRVDAASWSSGVYLYNLYFGEQVRTGKMILIK
jgi:hypothetical protein